MQGQVATPDAGADWRHQVAATEVPAGARSLGTQEGTNAHFLTRRMKHRGMAWTVPGAQATGKTRELITSGTLAPWSFGGATLARAQRPPRLAGLPGPPRPWPHVSCPAAHGALRDDGVAHVQRVLQGGYRLRCLSHTQCLPDSGAAALLCLDAAPQRAWLNIIDPTMASQSSTLIRYRWWRRPWGHLQWHATGSVSW